MKLIQLPIFALLVSGIFCQYDYDSYYNYDPASQMAPSSPICSVECDCPMNFPTAMYCDNRKLKTIPIIPSPIKYLYLQNNLLTGIPNGAFDNATELLWLILDNNQIASSNIGKKAFSKLKRLQKLYINFNNLTELVSIPKSLEDLKVYSNQISKIGKVLADHDNLTTIQLNDNQLSDVGEAFSGLKSLMYLDLSINKLTKLPAGLPSSLEMFYIDHNNLNSIPKGYFDKNSKLQYLRISHNQLKDEDIPERIFNITTLLELDLSFNKLKAIPVVNENLENLYLQANEIEKFSLSSFCRVTGPEEFSKVKHLRLDGNKITQADMPFNSAQCLRQAYEIMLD
ncbi:lumican [Callorhinchus milii]|uniref:Lumican n=1 Tax=Callorhinchus milii TaxID=7868 RepID=A0A4W3I2X8_CALMI|nr:lumican [Callorhinchus milii]|eukprot:gi/632955512/ref/XP_007893500.1/ PREDICTED: lumican [Callorhinchus milii]